MGTSPHEVRAVETEEELGRASELLSSNGVLDIAREQKDEPGSVRLLFRDEEAVGALVHRRDEWRIGQAELRVARAWECTGETGENAFRRTGRRDEFDALVSDWCGYLKEAGYHLAFTHGELALWPVHGFYPCFYHPRVYIPTAKARKLKSKYEVRGMMTRDVRSIRRLMSRNRHLRPRVFATGVPNFHHFAVEGPRRRIHGYFSMSVTDGNGRPPVFIPEVEVDDREAAETILAHAAPHAEEKGMRALHFPLAAEHPFAGVCLDLGGYFQLRGTTRDITLDEELVRVVDARACLEAMAGELSDRVAAAGEEVEGGEILLDVEDEKVPLRIGPRGVKVLREASGAQVVRLPRWAFTQLLMGYRAPSELRRGTIRPAAGVALLAPLFPKTWPLSLCDHDLWDRNLRDPEKYSPAALDEIRKLRYPF